MDNHRISASLDALFQQAPMTAATYMKTAVREIDELFGEGFAKKHPELIGQFMMTSAIDLMTGTLGKIAQEELGNVSAALTDVASNLLDLTGIDVNVTQK